MMFRTQSHFFGFNAMGGGLVFALIWNEWSWRWKIGWIVLAIRHGQEPALLLLPSHSPLHLFFSNRIIIITTFHTNQQYLAPVWSVWRHTMEHILLYTVHIPCRHVFMYYLQHFVYSFTHLPFLRCLWSRLPVLWGRRKKRARDHIHLSSPFRVCSIPT